MRLVPGLVSFAAVATREDALTATRADPNTSRATAVPIPSGVASFTDQKGTPG